MGFEIIQSLILSDHVVFVGVWHDMTKQHDMILSCHVVLSAIMSADKKLFNFSESWISSSVKLGKYDTHFSALLWGLNDS